MEEDKDAHTHHFYSILLEVLATTIRQIKGIQIGWEEVKLSLYADDMILYTENPKDSIQKHLEMINKFSKGAGYKINIQKLVVYLYNNNEMLEKEHKNTVPFKITPQKNQIPGHKPDQRGERFICWEL